jgi:hypothetical protein
MSFAFYTQRPSLQRFGLPLKLCLVLQVLATVVGTSYLALWWGQKQVSEAAVDLGQSVSEQIQQSVLADLAYPAQVGDAIANATQSGQINPADVHQLERFLLKLAEHDIVRHVAFWRPNQFQVVVTTPADGNPIAQVLPQQEPSPQVVPDWPPLANAYWSPLQVFSLGLRSQPHTQIALSRSQPIHNEAGQLVGIVSNRLTIDAIHRTLQNLPAGKTGQTFIIEKSGSLVATSHHPLPFVVQGKTLKRLSALDSAQPTIEQTTRQILWRYPHFKALQTRQQFTFDLNDERQFVQIIPIRDAQGIDWLGVVVVPESEFYGQMQAHVRLRMVGCLVAALGSMGVAIAILHWFTPSPQKIP